MRPSPPATAGPRRNLIYLVSSTPSRLESDADKTTDNLDTRYVSLNHVVLLITVVFVYDIDIFVDCNLVATRWQ